MGVWVSGTQHPTGASPGNQNFDLIDPMTGTIVRHEPSVGYGGYGGLTDKNGVIWSARPLLRWDTDFSLDPGDPNFAPLVTMPPTLPDARSRTGDRLHGIRRLVQLRPLHRQPRQRVEHRYQGRRWSQVRPAGALLGALHTRQPGPRAAWSASTTTCGSPILKSIRPNSRSLTRTRSVTCSNNGTSWAP